MYLDIKKGAIFVADSHFNEKNQEFKIFLEKLISKDIITTQLFLMGDIFDFISGESKYFIKKNIKVLKLLNKLSNKIQIIYLEGNHDYNLKPLFPKIKIFKREEQPIILKHKEKTVALSHGDNFAPWYYNLYCSLIRNSFVLHFLNFIDFNNIISKKIYYGLLKKNICHEIDDFDGFAKRRVANYGCDIVIEGHFHQGKTMDFKKQVYINVPSLCCSKKYLILNMEFEKRCL